MTGFHIWIAVVVACLIVLAIILTWTRTRRRMLKSRNEVDKEWAGFEMLLKQRNDELPKLIGICRGYLPPGDSAFQTLRSARTTYSEARSVPQKARANAALQYAINGLIQSGSRHPELKINNNFTQLQKQLVEVDKAIRGEEQSYNEKVSRYNRLLSRHQFMKRRLHLQPKEAFAITGEREGAEPAELSGADQKKV